ncbi:la-related protein 6b [Kryptolebias marmoratus]|uniref:la-related protein 6b n=1 Tax=Kryptolebias marmoratus TaxID=37003 RepID=UPI000D52F476|nr:la-related protein 6b [Kryptolebias marmoratus]
MSDLKRKAAQPVQDEEEHEGELLLRKIKTHLEEMFSDSYLAEDGFLLKHMQKNRQGYVSLKLLTCLKKIKALTTNWYMTLAAADCSDLLEVNDECTKVRRREPLPRWLLGSPTSRLLLVWNNSDEQRKDDGATSIQNPSLLLEVLEKFTVPSSVSSIWLLRPGEELPKELQCYTKRHKELGQHLCAVVKFNNLEAVRRTFDALKEEEKTNERGLRVVPLGWQSGQSVTKFEPSKEKHRNQPEEDICSEENLLDVPKVLVQHEPSSSSEGSSKTFPPEVCSSSFTSQSFCGLKQRYGRTSWGSGDHVKLSSQSPWVLRRKYAANAVNPNNARHPNAPRFLQSVLRQPLGPDGTRGFHIRRK